MDSEKIETDIEDSNPNAAGPQGLRGDMGVSSERTGHLAGAEADGEGVQGTGTRGTAATGTEGTTSMSGDEEGEPAADPAVGEVDPAVGESNTAEVPSHDFDRSRNPGHSHG